MRDLRTKKTTRRSSHQNTRPRVHGLKRPLSLERLEDRSMFAVFHGGEILGPLLPDPESQTSRGSVALLTLEQYVDAQQKVFQNTTSLNPKPANSELLAESGLMFDIQTTGAPRVYRGNSLYLLLSGTRLSGQTDNVQLGVAGTPAGLVVSFPEIVLPEYISPYMWQISSQFELLVKIAVPSSLAAGDYSFAVTFTSNGVLQSHTITLSVAEPTSIVPQPYAALGPVPMLDQYNQQMVSYGRSILSNESQIYSLGLWEGNVWYYDGARVAYQIADYTGDATFNTYAEYPINVYRPYVLNNNGSIGGWRVFAQGFRMDFERTGDLLSKEAALDLLNAAYGANTGVLTKYIVPESLSREVAYAIETMLEAEKLGQPRHPRLGEYVDLALGHINQWFISEQFTRMAPFMFALTAEALIGYHQATGDPRILPALKLGAEWIWAKTWVPADNAFAYEYIHGSPLGGGSPDLNLLIAPVFGWLYAQTGDASYIAKGDQVFAGGVQGAWLAQGKQFAQNYRWSMDYLTWRDQPIGELCPLPLNS